MEIPGRPSLCIGADTVEQVMVARGSPNETYERLLHYSLKSGDAITATVEVPGAAADSVRTTRLLAPDFILTALKAFDVVSSDTLRVHNLYLIRTPTNDPLRALRDRVCDSWAISKEDRPTDREMSVGLLLLSLSGLVYDFPLARRVCRSEEDAQKRQTRITGWGSEYFLETVLRRAPFKDLLDSACRFFQEQLEPIVDRVAAELTFVQRRQLSMPVGLIAP